MALDLTQPLPDLDSDAPAGPNLEFDADFGELERAAQGTPERQAGDKIVPAEDPVWKDVAKQAADLLERTYDLRVLTHLAVARLHTSGLPAFVTVLGCIASLLETRWAFVHPQLDPEDDNDPAMRSNALLPLAHQTRVLKVLRALPIAVSKRGGPISWRTVAVARGETDPPEGQERNPESEVRAAFADTPAQKVEALREQVTAALQALRSIKATFDNCSGYGNDPDLSALAKPLADINRYIGLYFVPDAPAPAEAEAASDAAEDTQAAYDDTPAPSSGGGGGGGRSSGGRAAPVTALSLSSVNNREEAVHLLDLVCRYYEQFEPSSPLPLMITRARRLADKGFLEILQELAPDGVFQAQSVVQSREGY